VFSSRFARLRARLELNSSRQRRKQARLAGPHQRPLELEHLEDRLAPATLTVNSLADTVSGTAATLDLREAILLVNSGDTATDASGNSLSAAKVSQIDTTNPWGTSDTIQFDAALTGQTITLGSALPALSSNLSVAGLGATNLFISGAGQYSVLAVNNGVTAFISGLTIENGYTDAYIQETDPNNLGQGGDLNLYTVNSTAYGGAISNADTLTVSDSAFTGNVGGSIFNGGTLTVSSCTFSANTGITVNTLAIFNSTLTRKDGSGIDNFLGLLTVSNSTFSGNDGNGLFTYRAANTTVSDSTFTHNSCGFGGSIEVIQNTLTINNSSFAYNNVGGIPLGSAGAIDSEWNTLAVSNSMFMHNVGDFAAGAIASGGAGATLMVSDCTFTDNSVGSGAGGGIFIWSGPATVINSTFASNSAGPGSNGGGAICHRATFSVGGHTYPEGLLTINNCTFSGNSGGTGGGIINQGTMTVSDCTFTNNHAVSRSGGGIANSGTCTVGNTIIAQDTAPNGPDVYGAVTSQGSNLIGDGSGSSGFGAPGDQVGSDANPIDPLLAQLADNGGPTQTMALMTGSLASGGGSVALAVDANGNPLLTDQRGFGFLRTVIDPTTGKPTIDIGAYQTQPTLSPRDFLEAVVSGSLPVDPTTGNPTAVLSLDLQAQADAFVRVFSTTNLNPLTVPSGSATPIDIAVSLASGIQVKEADLSIPTGFRVSINGGTWYGGSPALTLKSGNLTITNATFQNATDAPTILVAGGSLTLRNDVVQESTGYTDAAIRVTGGTLDLGTPASPGGNTLNVNGSGQFVQNTTGSLVPATGDTFGINGLAQAAPFLSFTALNSSAASSVYGQTITLTATVTPDAAGAATPTGSVDFYDVSTSTDLGSAMLSGGSSSLATSALGAGTHWIRVTYAGDNNYLPSLDSLTQIVTRATLSVTANNQTKVYGAALPTLTGTLAGVVNGDNITASFSTTATAASDVVPGGYTITATLNDPNGRLSNYTVTNTPGTLTITPANQTISWTNPAQTSTAPLWVVLS
jgi:hypothetical protein